MDRFRLAGSSTASSAIHRRYEPSSLDEAAARFDCRNRAEWHRMSTRRPWFCCPLRGEIGFAIGSASTAHGRVCDWTRDTGNFGNRPRSVFTAFGYQAEDCL